MVFGVPRPKPSSVVRVEEFREARQQRELREDVAAAEAELDAGLGIPHEEVKRQAMAFRIKKRKELRL